MTSVRPEQFTPRPMDHQSALAALNSEPADYRGYTTRYGARAMVTGVMERGEMPRLDNDWTFVVDRRPAGATGDRIPVREFVAYFGNRSVPIADIDHDMHDHDAGHVVSYQDMFRSRLFADVVHETAQATVGQDDDALYNRFGNAIDGLSEAIGDLDVLKRGVVLADIRLTDHVAAARRHLTELIDMHQGTSTPTDKKEMFDQLWAELNLDAYQCLAAEHDKINIERRDVHQAGGSLAVRNS